MIVLINGGPPVARFGNADYLGRLVSPRCGNVVLPGEKWAGDNDAFAAWDEDRFVAMLNRVDDWPGCLFVACPDVVGNARSTLERFEDWNREISGRGLPVAFVGQDGAEDSDIPWDQFDAWFVGGTDRWKLSAHSADLVHEAKSRGKWAHMGRVNSMRRMRFAYDFGCDSIDGTGWSRFPDQYLKEKMPYLRHIHRQKTMF